MNLNPTSQEKRDAKEKRIRELADKRYAFLTEDFAGIGEVIDSLCQDTGWPLDKALYAFYVDKGQKLQSAVEVYNLLEGHASKIARQWAVEQEEDEHAEAEYERCRLTEE